MTKLDDVQTPLNSMERFLYAIVVRQDIIIEQNNSIIEHLSKQGGVATTTHINEETVVQPEPTPAPVPTPRKRAPRKPKVEE